MTSSVDEAAIRGQVDLSLPTLEQSTNDELLAAIGSIPFNPAFSQVQAPQELLGYGTPNFGLARLGEAFLKTNERVREVVCNNKTQFSGVINGDNVTKLLLIVLPALGMIGVAAPPASAIALAVFLLKIGLNEYCKSQE